MGRDVLFTVLAFALFGLSKLAFNATAIRALDPSVVGDINSALAFHTILLVFTSQPIASIVNRFAPEHLAVGDRGSARSLLVRGLAFSLAASGFSTLFVCVGVWMHSGAQPTGSLFESPFLLVAIPYLWAYGMYFFFKMTYYGYRRIGEYCIAETLSSLCFFAALIPAAIVKSPNAFILPWIVHPLVFCACAMWYFRGEFRISDAAKPDRAQTRIYARYGLYWLMASASGLGAYHLSILFTRALQPSAVAVGYYSVALSLLTPLNLLPTSVAMVLFPRITGNYAVGGDLMNADLIRKATAHLLLPLALSLVTICGLAPEILGVMIIPTTSENILTFQLVTWGLTASLLSTPAGSFLSATAYAGTASMIGVATLAVGVATWLWAIPVWGVVGTSVGYAALMMSRGVANVLISNHHRRWTPPVSWREGTIFSIGGLSASLAYTDLTVATRAILIGSMALAVMYLLSHEVISVTQGIMSLLPRSTRRS